jgi:O-antigen ligase
MGKRAARAALFLFGAIRIELLVAFLALSWLLPNHFIPWTSAWQDGLAILPFGLAQLLKPSKVSLSSTWAAFLALAFISVALQFAISKIFFCGDALLVSLYLVAFGMAALAGTNLIQPNGFDQTANVSLLALAIVVAAITSIGIALVQWTGALSLGMWLAEMPPGGRPFGNVAQPNHLCTISFLGLCSLALLRQRRQIGSTGFWLAALWLAFGMVMTGSRTGWLQMIFLLAMVIVIGKQNGVWMPTKGMLVLIGIYALMVLAWPTLNEWTLLSEGRTREDALQGGSRRQHWAAMLDAISREPLWGYGWQQVSVAQVRVADAHPFVGEYIEHSHNLVLDLMVWCGVPVGLTLAGMALWWFATRLQRSRNPEGFWILACIAGLVMHSMVEYPLEYAYFLIPLGLWTGAIDKLQKTPGGIVLGRNSMRACGVLLLGFTVWLAIDYLKAEEGYRLMRMESAHIGVSRITTPPPRLQLLTQLEAFQRFAQTEARAGMTPEELDFMRKVSERYAYPPSLFRYALAQGLNGQPDGASLTLLRLCRIHPLERCQEMRESWPALLGRYPQLAPIRLP